MPSVDNSHEQLPGVGDQASMRVAEHESDRGSIMAKRKKGSKVQSRAKLRRANSAKRGKAAKVAKSAKATKRTVARPKPKRTAEVRKQPVRETVVVDVVEQAAPGVITVTEFEETVTREEGPSPG